MGAFPKRKGGVVQNTYILTMVWYVGQGDDGMVQKDLNGEEILTDEKKEPKQEKVSKDELQALTSYFYKLCRIGDSEKAVVIGERLRRVTSDYNVMRLLTNLIGEDSSPRAFLQLRGLLQELKGLAGAKKLDYHDLWQAIFLVADSSKWYQTEDGKRLEKARHIAKEDVLPDWAIVRENFPLWVWDGHTSKYWDRKKDGLKVDLRLDGHWWNRWKIAKLYQDAGSREKFIGDLETEKGEIEKEKEFHWRTVERGIYEVESETTTGKWYLVDLFAGSCSCPHHQTKKVECKHLRFAYKTISFLENLDVKGGEKQ